MTDAEPSKSSLTGSFDTLTNRQRTAIIPGQRLARSGRRPAGRYQLVRHNLSLSHTDRDVRSHHEVPEIRQEIPSSHIKAGTAPSGTHRRRPPVAANRDEPGTVGPVPDHGTYTHSVPSAVALCYETAAITRVPPPTVWGMASRTIRSIRRPTTSGLIAACRSRVASADGRLLADSLPGPSTPWGRTSRSLFGEPIAGGNGLRRTGWVRECAGRSWGSLHRRVTQGVRRLPERAAPAAPRRTRVRAGEREQLSDGGDFGALDEDRDSVHGGAGQPPAFGKPLQVLAVDFAPMCI